MGGGVYSVETLDKGTGHIPREMGGRSQDCITMLRTASSGRLTNCLLLELSISCYHTVIDCWYLKLWKEKPQVTGHCCHLILTCQHSLWSPCLGLSPRAAPPADLVQGRGPRLSGPPLLLLSVSLLGLVK